MAATKPPVGIRTLAIDIGGTGTKMQVLDSRGFPITERNRVATPPNVTPVQMLTLLQELASLIGPFDRVSVGFPGVVKRAIIYTAPNLGKGWVGFPLGARLSKALRRPVRVANDADVQGLASVKGKGVEMVLTLGTGCGTVLFINGHRIHLELAHHLFRKGQTYEEQLGNKALRNDGKRRWNRRLKMALELLEQTFLFDHLYLGGGNTKFISFQLPKTVSVVANTRGLLGGIKLWEEPA